MPEVVLSCSAPAHQPALLLSHPQPWMQAKTVHAPTDTMRLTNTPQHAGLNGCVSVLMLSIIDKLNRSTGHYDKNRIMPSDAIVVCNRSLPGAGPVCHTLCSQVAATVCRQMQLCKQKPCRLTVFKSGKSRRRPRTGRRRKNPSTVGKNPLNRTQNP